MRILAIESSGLTAGAAVVEEGHVLGEYTLNDKKTHSQTLLPMIDELKKMLELDLGTLDAIAVSKGPGSFTGLRIGSATAKGLAMALNKPVAAVPTTEAMAYQIYGTAHLICPIMDARRAQVYTGLYEYTGDVFSVVEGQQALSVEELCKKLNGIGRSVLFLGDGVPVYREQLQTALQVPYCFAPAFAASQRAAALGMRALQYYKEGKLERAEDHKPEYLRLSQAERERLERERAHGNS